MSKTSIDVELEQKLLGTEIKEYTRYKSHYALTALLAGFLIGIHNFINSTMVGESMELRIIYPGCVGSILLFMSYHSYIGFKLY